MSKEAPRSLQHIFERYQDVSPTAFFTHIPDKGNTFLSVISPDSGIAVLSQNSNYLYYTLDADANKYLTEMGLTSDLLEAMKLQDVPFVELVTSAHMDSSGVLSFIHPDDGNPQSNVSYDDFWPGYMCDMVAPEDIVANVQGYDALTLRYNRPGNKVPQIDEQFICSYAHDVQNAFTALRGMPMSSYIYGRN